MRLAMLGVSHPRLGGERLATGRGRFVADVRPEGLLEAAVLRSPHAHARVLRVDAARALRLPGVRAVLTAADVPASAVIPNRVPAPEGTAAYLQPAIARGVVRYVGEPVALVVADDRYVAEDALALVHVDYEPLPACASVAAALAPDAQRLFAGTDGNNVATIRMRVGDAGAALAGAHLVLHERFRHPRQTAAALETRGLVAVPPDPRGGELHLIGSTKCIHINRGILAPIFGIPPGALRLTEVDVGGGFGVRGELYPEDILVPLAALALGRPVRWIEDRRENFIAANHAREVEYDLEIGLDPAGRILWMRAVIHADIGAYVRTAALVPAEFGAALLPGPYRVPAYACDLWSVVTNKTPVGTLRSPGRPECNFARERLLDLAATRLGLDPAELRRRNLIRPDEMPYDTGTTSFGATTVYDSGDFPALFEELLRRLDYNGARTEQRLLAARGVRGRHRPVRARGRQRRRQEREPRRAGRARAPGCGRVVQRRQGDVRRLRRRRRARRGRGDGAAEPPARGRRRRRRPRRQPRAHRGAARRRRRVRHRQRALGEPRVRRRGPAALRHAARLPAAAGRGRAADRVLLPRGARADQPARASRPRRVREPRAGRRHRQRRLRRPPRPRRHAHGAAAHARADPRGAPRRRASGRAR